MIINKYNYLNFLKFSVKFRNELEIDKQFIKDRW